MYSFIDSFDLFLFDFDGLLVNTEELHYKAYKQMCAQHGINLYWNFKRYCQFAHYSSNGVRDQLYLEFPQLRELSLSWDALYEEKKQALLALIESEPIPLMPGVEALLLSLQENKKRSCVVTHSPSIIVDQVRAKNPLLGTIPYWITRESYIHPKPNPECYQVAIAKLQKQKDRIIGFEDTPRGVQALMQTKATPLLITEISYPEIPSLLQQGVFHFSSFETISLP